MLDGRSNRSDLDDVGDVGYEGMYTRYGPIHVTSSWSVDFCYSPSFIEREVDDVVVAILLLS